MFFFLYLNRIKCSLRDRTLLFWTLLFPLILATLFNFTLTGIATKDTFTAIPLALVDSLDTVETTAFKSTMDALSSGDQAIFNIRSIKDEAEGKALMANDQVKGVITLLEGKPHLSVGKSGLEESILKSVLDQYNQATYTASQIAKENPAAFTQSFIRNLNQPKDFITEGTLVDKSLNTLLISFYSLLGMSCFYGSFLGQRDMMDIQANLSARAARIALAPTHKLKVLLANFLATLTIHFFNLLLLMAYLFFILKIQMGAYLPQTLLIVFSGAICGITFGMLIGVLFKCSEGLKIGILVSFTMILSFLSGMMSPAIQDTIARNFPILAILNPVNQITEGFYTLYYYGPGPQFYQCIILLLAFSTIFTIITYFFARRQQYASI